MISQRVLAASSAARNLAQLLQSNCRISSTATTSHGIVLINNTINTTANTATSFGRSSLTQMRRLSSGASGPGNDDKDMGNNKSSSTNNNESDPFGVRFEDGEDNVGPYLPPKYRRDAATGKLTGDIEAELTPQEREILNMDPLEQEKHLLKRLVQSWENTEGVDEKTGDPKALANFARRVRLAKMALNVLGRTVQAQSAKSVMEDGTELGREKETGFTQPLTQGEFQTFQKYMKDQHGKTVTEEDIPVHPDNDAADRGKRSFRSRSPLEDDDIAVQGITDDSATDPDNPDLSLKWLTSRAQWEINKKFGEDGPFDEMMPRDLNLTRIVNRKRAKILPRELLHHNNLSLLRRYISPAGQIMHRVRTRLGARDQRRVAKLVKRARNLGLIPHTGQFVVEDHGDIHEKDIRDNKPWEEELIRRGLVVTKKTKNEGRNELS